MDVSHLPNVAGIVLAAGRSTRMGQNKLLLPLRGEPLLSPVLRAALTCNTGGYPLLWPVVGVVPPSAKPELRGVMAQHQSLYSVVAEDADEGMAASLRAGLREVLRVCDPVTPDGVCVLLGDQPLVDANLLYALLDAFAYRPDAFIVPTHKGERGNPVIIPYFFFEEVLQLRGDVGARGLLRRPHAVVRTVEVATPSVLLDVDTVEAYAKIKAFCGD